MNLAETFARAVERNQDRPAIFWGADTLSYGAVERQASWLADQLQRTPQVRAGDRVAIWLKNCPEFIPALYAILKLGAVVAPINNFLKPDEVLYILQDAGANVLITDDSMAEGTERLRAALPGLKVLTIGSLAASAAESTAHVPPVPRKPDDLAVLIYTSGTTGRPKGAMLTHGNLGHNVESCRIILKIVSLDRFAVVLPLFHSFMLTVGILLPLSVGGSLVLVKSLHPPKNIIQEIFQHGATILPAIPQLFRALAHAQLPPGLPLRLCISGAAPLPVEVLKEFNARFPIALIEGYGLSEASPVVSLNPIEGPWKAGSIGLPIPHVEVTIQNDEGRELPVGEIGELCVRGGNVMAGYWQKPEATAAAMRGDWLLTGDIGYKDADGYIYITDRKKDMLLVNGINVYPREVEEIIYQYPGIKEAAVIGRPDPRKGEQPVAFVALNDGVTLDSKALLEFLRPKLADYKLPRHVHTLPALPRNATGKILKTALREMVREPVSTSEASPL